MRIRASAFVIALLVMPVLSSVSVVDAQPADQTITDAARQRFQEGVELFDKGRYEEARASFLQAYALRKHPAVLLNLAHSEVKSRYPVEAARHFSEYLRDNPGASQAERNSAAAGLQDARTKTARIVVVTDVVNATVLIDGVAVGATPLPEPADAYPGVRKIEVRATGQSPKSAEVNAVLGQFETVEIYFNSDGAAATTAPGTGAGPVPTPPSSGNDVEPASPGGRESFFSWVGHDGLAWATLGVAVAGVGVGTGFAIGSNTEAKNTRNTSRVIRETAKNDSELPSNRRDSPCASPVFAGKSHDYRKACAQLQDELDKRDTYMTVAIIGFSVAGAAAIATGILYFPRAKTDTPANSSSVSTALSTAKVSPIIGAGFQGLAIGGSF